MPKSMCPSSCNTGCACTLRPVPALCVVVGINRLAAAVAAALAAFEADDGVDAVVEEWGVSRDVWLDVRWDEERRG